MMIPFPLQSARPTLIPLGTLSGMATQFAAFVADERPNAARLLFDSHGIPESEYVDAARQLAIGYCLGHPGPGALDAARVEEMTYLLMPREVETTDDKLKIWPNNPFAGIVFAVSGVAALITLLFFLTGHPFLGAGCAAVTAAAFLLSLNLNGNS
jgi:hypothetical protein